MFPPGSAWDAFSLGVMGLEMLSTAATTIQRRVLLMQTLSPWDPRYLTEWNRMVGEKALAGFEVGLAMQKASLDFWSGAFQPLASARNMLIPLHTRTTANSRRLQRRR